MYTYVFSLYILLICIASYSYLLMSCTLFLIIAEFCGNPEDRTFPTISKWIYADWKHIGLLLEVKQFTLDCIDLNYQRVEDKALHMLIKWKSSNPHACYCHLLSALREQDLPKAVEDFKGLLRTCVYKKVHHYYETAV